MCWWQFVGGLDEEALAGMVEVGTAGEQGGTGDAEGEQGFCKGPGEADACSWLRPTGGSSAGSGRWAELMVPVASRAVVSTRLGALVT